MSPDEGDEACSTVSFAQSIPRSSCSSKLLKEDDPAQLKVDRKKKSEIEKVQLMGDSCLNTDRLSLRNDADFINTPRRIAAGRSGGTGTRRDESSRCVRSQVRSPMASYKNVSQLDENQAKQKDAVELHERQVRSQAVSSENESKLYKLLQTQEGVKISRNKGLKLDLWEQYTTRATNRATRRETTT
jgi:hypothetical protein